MGLVFSLETLRSGLFVATDRPLPEIGNEQTFDRTGEDVIDEFTVSDDKLNHG